MLYRIPIGAIAFAAALGVTSAQAFDESRYPDFAGQWRKPNGVTVQWDQTKPLGLAQKAPLKPEFQAALEASLKDQTLGGQGDDARYSCLPNGMPRIMTVVWPMEIVITPRITYVMFENNQHVVIGKEGYYLSADGYLMPVKKGQKPPDLRYFKETQK